MVTSSDVRYRSAVPGDAAGLVALQRQIYREDRWFVGDGPPAETTLARRLREADPVMSLWLVAEDGRNILGWLELHRLPALKLRHVASLTVAVSAMARRRGIGSALMANSFSWARKRGVRKITLNVRAGNRAAISLYESLGFVLEGREREQVMTDEGFEDNLIMARFLAE